MELELTSEGKEPTDKTTPKSSLAKLEKVALKKEILTLKEMTTSLAKKSAVSTTTPKSKEEKELETYFLKLCENTQQQAEQSFENKYGKAELDALLNASENQQPKKNY